MTPIEAIACVLAVPVVAWLLLAYLLSRRSKRRRK